jgi:hypothetical protein
MELVSRAVKAAYTVASQSSLGQRLILRSFGEDGEALVDAVDQAISSIQSKACAEEFKSELLALGLHLSVLIDEGILSKESLVFLDKAFIDASNVLSLACLRKENSMDQIRAVIQAFERFALNLDRVLSPYCKEETRARFSKTAKKLGTVEFVQPLLQRDDFESQRVHLGKQLSIIATKASDSDMVALEAKNVVSSLEKLKLTEGKSTTSTGPGAKTAKIAEFMFNEKAYQYLLEWGKTDANLDRCFRVLVAIDEYRSGDSKLSRVKVAHKISQKFLEEKSDSCLAETILSLEKRKSIVDKIQKLDSMPKPRANFFDELYKVVIAYLDDRFQSEFPKSIFYRKMHSLE